MPNRGLQKTHRFLFGPRFSFCTALTLTLRTTKQNLPAARALPAFMVENFIDTNNLTVDRYLPRLLFQSKIIVIIVHLPLYFY